MQCSEVQCSAVQFTTVPHSAVQIIVQCSARGCWPGEGLGAASFGTNSPTTLYTLHSALYSTQGCTLYSALHSTQGCTVHYTLHKAVQCTTHYAKHCSTVHSTLHSANVLYWGCRVQSSTPCSLLHLRDVSRK